MSLNWNLTQKLKNWNFSGIPDIFWIWDKKRYLGYLKITLFSFLWSDSSSVTKIKWNWYPICQIWPKNGRFQGNSRVPGNSWKIPGMMDFINSALKIKFFDKNWVGKIPYTLKLAKTRQIQGIPGFLEFWIPGSRTPKMLPNVRKNNTIMLWGLFLF